MHKAKKEMTEKVLKQVVNEGLLSNIRYLTDLLALLQDKYAGKTVNQGYEAILEFLQKLLTFLGHEITIYAPFTINVVEMYNSVLSKYLESLDKTRETSNFSISTFIMLMLERNEAYFTKKPGKVTKSIDKIGKAKVQISDKLLECTKMVGKLFIGLMCQLKASLALNYNKGKNVAFPEFGVSIKSRLRKLAQAYKELEENINSKNSQEKSKDSRNKIYASRIFKINKLIESIDGASNATLSIRNEYAKSVNVDTHRIDKMIEY